MIVFVSKLLAVAVSSTVLTVLGAAHAVVTGAITAPDVVAVGAGGASLLYLAWKVLQDETIAKRERRLFHERLRFERQQAWQLGKDGEALPDLEDQ